MRRNPVLPAVFLSGVCLLFVLLLVASGYTWKFFRPQPKSERQQLFEGITYEVQVRKSPRPMIIHVVTVDLREPGISFLVTPGDANKELPLEARTTGRFLDEFNVQLAVNGDGFLPWRSNSILDYYPHNGDPVDPIGFAASRGEIYSALTDAEPVLYISRTNQARFQTPIGRIYNAISGNLMLVEQGRVVVGTTEDTPQPRTAVALDKAGKRLILVVVDGRQPRYSQGATLAELAEIILDNDGYFGMNLDGGGSTTLVKTAGNGKSALLNSPINHGIPGFQRPVGNHLGIFADLVSGEN
jgi:Phosphodiester glycosidase